MKNRFLVAFSFSLAWLFISVAGCKDSVSNSVVEPPGDPQSATPDSVNSPVSSEPTTAGRSAGQPLPTPPIIGGNVSDSPDAADATPGEELPEWEPDEGPTAEEVASKAFLPPPDAKSLTQKGRLWIDPKRQRVFVDGYVALKQGALEMFACPVGTKEHESVVAVLARSQEVHAALLAVEATPGTPVRFRPEFLPPTGQIIRIWVCWYDSNDEFHVVDARNWVMDLDSEKAMTAEWVFAGSGFWQDEETKQEHYLADSGDMICVSNFSSALLDVAMPSSAETDSLRFVPFESQIPDRDTPVRLILVPVPFPSDSPATKAETNLLDKPSARDVPRQK